MKIMRKTAAAASIAIALTSCGETSCTDMGGESAIYLSVPKGGKILEFCVGGFDCVVEPEGITTSVFVDDDDKFLYNYVAVVEVGGREAEFSSEVEAEPLFPNGEDCGRSGKRARLMVTDPNNIEEV